MLSYPNQNLTSGLPEALLDRVESIKFEQSDDLYTRITLIEGYGTAACIGLVLSLVVACAVRRAHNRLKVQASSPPRNKRNAPSLLAAQETASPMLQAWHFIRKYYPDIYQQSWDVPKLFSYDVRSPAPWLLITFDYALLWFCTGEVMKTHVNPTSFPYWNSIVVAYLIGQLHCWSMGYLSLLGWMTNIYLMQCTTEIPASSWRVVAAGLIEGYLIYLTGGASGVVGLVCRSVRQRQTLGEFLLGVQPVQEIRTPVRYQYTPQAPESIRG